MKYVGVDGCPDGWLAVEYTGAEFQAAEQFDNIGDLWDGHDDAELILIDVPIGLREEDATPRPCDAAARKKLGSPRSSSVFPTPVRGVLKADSYEEARETQEEMTDGSLGAQTWGISEKIEQLDEFMRDDEVETDGVVRESHPEVCFWSLNEEEATEYSKTGAPVAAFWERIEILEKVDDEILGVIRNAGTDLQSEATMDDLLDAFVLAMTASPATGEIETLSAPPESNDANDPKELPMEMVYAQRSQQ